MNYIHRLSIFSTPIMTKKTKIYKEERTMMNLYKAAAEWAMYNWENFRVFYIMLGVSGALMGAIVWELVRTIFERFEKEES